MTQTSLDAEELSPEAKKCIEESFKRALESGGWLGDAIYKGPHAHDLWCAVKNDPAYDPDRHQTELVKLLSAALPDLISNNVEDFENDTRVIHYAMGPGDAAEHDLRLTEKFNVVAREIWDLNQDSLADAEKKSIESAPHIPVSTRHGSIYREHKVSEDATPVITMLNVLGNFSGDPAYFPGETLKERLEQIHMEGGIYFITLDSTDDQDKLDRTYAREEVDAFLLDALKAIDIDDVKVTRKWHAESHCYAHYGESEKHGKFGLMPSWRPSKNMVEKIANSAGYDHIQTYGVGGMNMYVLRARPKAKSFEQSANDNPVPDEKGPLAAPGL